MRIRLMKYIFLSTLKSCSARCQIFHILFLVFLLSFLFGTRLLHAEDVIATGENLKVTQEDVDELAAFFKQRHFESSPEGYREAAVKLKLFSMEAKALGLEKDIKDLDQFEEGSVGYMNELQKRYNFYILESHPVGDKTIESYYWAHPDYFFDKENHDKEKFPEPDLLPLTPELKDKIREKVIFGQKEMLNQKAYEALKDQYKVRFCDGEEGC